MARSFALIALGLVTFALGVAAQECNCTGLDYTDGGSYLIDGNSDTKFSFNSAFYGVFYPGSSVRKLLLTIQKAVNLAT